MNTDFRKSVAHPGSAGIAGAEDPCGWACRDSLHSRVFRLFVRDPMLPAEAVGRGLDQSLWLGR